jgi:hypothetical protein
MMAQRFVVGQTVSVIAGPYLPNAQGKFSVLSVLPEEHGMHQYRIKSVTDEHVYLVMETELV